MKIYFNGWFSGFNDKINPGLHVEFFLNLFNKVYNEKCENCNNITESNVLCEFDMMINSKSLITSKKWLHTYLFSGESTLKCNKSDYTCVLWGERNNNNVVNVPLFIPYIYSNNFLSTLETKIITKKIPEKDICVIISNTKGNERIQFLNELEKHFNICYAGVYKNNTKNPLKHPYNTKEYFNFISQFKFVITMENSREDTYITEKLINGIMSNTIPVYWGSERVTDYINYKRFIDLDDVKNSVKIIQRMKNIKQNNKEWLRIVNENIFSNTENKLERTIDNISEDIKCLLTDKYWNHISKIHCVSNPKFEPERYGMLKNLFNSQNINSCFINYISPTYKHTITEEIYNKHVKEQLVLNLRNTKLKKSELSLFLNYKANLEHIVKNYKDGLFLIFESDAMLGKDIEKLNDFLNNIKNKKWDLIHIGMSDKRIWETPNFIESTGYKDRKFHEINIEDITNEKETFRLSRKFYTRCTDSFLWRYDSVVKFLNWLNNTDINYGIPFDYYMCNFFEKNINFKHYWSEDEFFKQGSNLKLIKTTIQCPE